MEHCNRSFKIYRLVYRLCTVQKQHVEQKMFGPHLYSMLNFEVSTGFKMATNTINEINR